MTTSSDQEFVVNWLESHEGFTTSFVEKWLQNHPHFTRLYMEKHSNVVRNPSTLIPRPLAGALDEGNLLKHNISTTNLHINRRKKSTTELRRLNRHELFMELLQDVVAPDFDVNSLTHKILVNVLVLTNADRSSMFLVEGPENNQFLISRLFDITENSTVEESLHGEADSIKIPIGVGIIGHAAQTGETINLQDAYEDPRFNPAVDKHTGYRTKSILCMPIKAPDGQVIGVAQVMNKNVGKDVFTKQDEEEFQRFLTFCAIGLINAQLFDQSFALSRRLQVLLQLARGLFEETTSLEAMMQKVMLESLELIPCERCTVLLIDQEKEETQDVTFSRAFTMDRNKVLNLSNTSVRSTDAKAVSDLNVAKHVATNAQPLNVNSSTGSTQFSVHKDSRNVLCMPIFNKDGNTIGVAKLTNKVNGLPFNQADQDSFEVFATFCGLGIHNMMYYDRILKANAKQSVALEMLSYHASASVEETQKFMEVKVPEASAIMLESFGFDDLPLKDDHTVLASIRMFIDCGFIERFRIDMKVLYRWVLTVKKNYRQVTYHNWRHAFNVAQTMFAMFTTGQLTPKLTDVERMAMLVACFCHDLDHRGTNNAFQSKTDNALAQLYSTSTMEHHHFDHCIMILNSQGNQLLNGLTTSEYSVMIKTLEGAILSTDLALYFRKKGQFKELVEQHKFDWANDDHRDTLRGMLMTACDVSAIAKPWEIQKRVAELVTNEFFEQGDVERDDLNFEPIAMMDRKKKDELPKMQVGFINAICLPLYEILADLLDGLEPLLAGCRDNRNNWQSLADNPMATAPSCTSPLPLSPESPSRPIEAWRGESVDGEESSKESQRHHNNLVEKRKRIKCTLC